ncbi:MAG: nucleotide sugar dehydrogenase [Desulfovibrionaceae bacterium]|nr:nucleotide sugar dehydrogenase [Desulfovibrionaceae bacterium]
MKIAIAGTGYVGLSLAVLLAQHNDVTAVDILPEKIEQLNKRQSPIKDQEIEKYLAQAKLSLTATLDAKEAYRTAELIIIATPTNYDLSTNHFDTSSIEAVLEVIRSVNPLVTVVIKSTVPVGFLQEVMQRFPELPNMLFSPEFLREGRALYDNLHPSRIIVGVPEGASEHLQEQAKCFAKLLQEGAIDRDVPCRIVKSTEAECIKLFANTYLALRVAYFNELDTYAEQYGLNAPQIIDGICLDPRIGAHYNNPSFGYGGYCLPKDTRQLVANFVRTPCSLIPAIVAANTTRKHFIVRQILAKKAKVVGIYRLIMKAGSDNFRQAAMHDVLKGLREAQVKVVLYEPMLSCTEYEACPVVHNLANFAEQVDLIVANRMTEELEQYKEKIYTRDIFARD